MSASRAAGNPEWERKGRPGEQVLADLAEIEALAGELGVSSSEEDFDTGLTTDDMLR